VNASSSPTRVAAGFGLLALLLAYAIFVHHGVGPVRDPLRFAWYQPRGFFFEWMSTDALTSSLWNGLVGFGGTALLLAAGVWLTLRSALARLAAAWAVLFVLLCVYYGIEADGIWRFFHWRGSGVMALLALVVAGAGTSPWLAGAAERTPWPLRLALYAPVVIGVLALMRNATGTDHSLQFALSPWPVVPVFGLEVLVPAVSFVIAVVALGRALVGGLVEPLALLGVSCALVLVAIATLAGWASVDASADWKLPAAALCIAGLGLVAAPARAQAGHLAAVGALATTIPVLVGMAIVERDYTFTRDARATQITEALQAYYDREEEYPDKLTELVERDLLEAVPVPRVGFSFIEEQEFVFQNFGISYLLEFSTPRWVQCAYNPPYQDEEGFEDEPDDDDEGFEEEQDDDEGDLPGSWSCPSKPPELW
jgi:hypothetical protein